MDITHNRKQKQAIIIGSDSRERKILNGIHYNMLVELQVISMINFNIIYYFTYMQSLSPPRAPCGDPGGAGISQIVFIYRNYFYFFKISLINFSLVCLSVFCNIIVNMLLTRGQGVSQIKNYRKIGQLASQRNKSFSQPYKMLVDQLVSNKIKGNRLASKPARNRYDICHRDEVIFNSLNAKIYNSNIWECQLVLHK